MSPKPLLIATAFGLVFTMSAFAETSTSEVESKTKVTRDSQGDLHKKSTVSESVSDSAGSASSETKTTEEARPNGETETKTKTTEVNDPKGLFNKTKTVTTDTTEHKGGKTTTHHVKKVDGHKTEDTAQSQKDAPVENAPSR